MAGTYRVAHASLPVYAARYGRVSMGAVRHNTAPIDDLSRLDPRSLLSEAGPLCGRGAQRGIAHGLEEEDLRV